MFSVIVPVYKVENYVEACIASLLGQTWRDFEMIVVDDGSPDRSMEIVAPLLEHCSGVPVQIIRQKNAGVSAARNAGLGKATGEYVIFVDADDVVSPDFLGAYAALIEAHPQSDVYSTGFTVCPEKETGKFLTERKAPQTLSWEQAQMAFHNRTIKFLLPTLLLRRTFLEQNGILFDEKVRYSEDVQFIWRCLAYNRRPVIHSEDSHYHYILHAGSTMTASDITKIMTGVDGLRRLCEETEPLYCDEIREGLAARQVFSILHGAAKMLSGKAFVRLCREADCKHYLRKEAVHGSLKTKIAAGTLLISRTLGYQVMRRF